jgi:hypothetical protein
LVIAIHLLNRGLFSVVFKKVNNFYYKIVFGAFKNWPYIIFSILIHTNRIESKTLNCLFLLVVQKVGAKNKFVLKKTFTLSLPR